ncbi:MAG TPA: alpha/beta fold hydrolase [Oscillospiraceae bacterium]|nr:alpha/beta fold hydrolase [Oscillospiraceae bacterium]HPF55421.1 alpha/beta fold hydrolase [Clostridiales bacterium]HPK34457.1 alpha/beta fold hydrolase [Oscillospiraceae bacterium]HPR76437.1 alpha/beta fold hydrolase [Oscillospiraceae bacterium]
MQKKEISYPSANGTDTIRAYIRLPEEPEKAIGIVQISHGVCEYFGRYEWFCDFLCKNGLIVCGNDHLGHGNSVKTPEDLGYFAKKDGWKFLSEDVYTLTKLIKEQYPNLPVFLFGHSMGSYIARAYLNAHGGELAGAILCGTSPKNPKSAIGKILTAMYTLFKGDRYRSAFAKNLACDGYLDRIPNHRTENDWLTKDAMIVDKYCADPLCNYTVTVSGYYDLIKILEFINTPKGVENIPKDLPIFFVFGTDDPVSEYGRGPAQTISLLESAGCTRCSIKGYDGDRHELLNELDRERVAQDILDFIQGRISER